jgi:hypothetical protein
MNWSDCVVDDPSGISVVVLGVVVVLVELGDWLGFADLMGSVVALLGREEPGTGTLLGGAG